MMSSSALGGHLTHLSFHLSLYPKLVLRCIHLFDCLLVFQHKAHIFQCKEVHLKMTTNLEAVPPPSGKDKNYINLTLEALPGTHRRHPFIRVGPCMHLNRSAFHF